MEKLNIGITAGSHNGESYKLILSMFENPSALEICNPMLYGNLHEAISQRKLHGIQTNFISLKTDEEPHEGYLCLFDCTSQSTEDTEEDNVATEEAACLEKALLDFENGTIDALVIGPTKRPISYTEESTEMIISNKACVTIATKAIWETDQPNEAETKAFAQEIRHLNDLLRRDFGIVRARIGLLTEKEITRMSCTSEIAQQEENEEKTETPQETKLQEILEEHICICGPYSIRELCEEKIGEHLDWILAPNQESAKKMLELLEPEYAVRYFAGNKIITTPYHNKQSHINHAIYTAIDIHRKREEYELITKAPLEKLFHDKRPEKKNNIE